MANHQNCTSSGRRLSDEWRQALCGLVGMGVDHLEARLGMPTDAAYLQAGMVPVWAIRFDPAAGFV